MGDSYDNLKLSVCRLCLKMTPDDSCSILTKETWTILKALIPDMTVSLSKDHVTKICNICTEVLQTTDKFRKECFNNNSQKINSTDGNICALCQKDNVDVHEEDIKRQKDALHKCFPDLEIDFKEKSSCCKVCSELLEKFLTFVKNYRKTEEDIRSYCLNTGKSSQEANMMEKISAFISSNLTTVPFENKSTKDSQADNNGVNENTTATKKKRSRHSKKMVLTNRYNCANCSYSSNHKSALISHMVSHRALSESTDFKCEICNHQTKRKADLRAHMIIHKASTELKMFKCTLCSYESRRNSDVKQHMSTHRINVYKCKFCPFETGQQKYFENYHMLLHKDKSELQIYKCEKCPYETVNKFYIKRHALTHTEEWFSCNWCSFTTYRKTSLQKHIYLLHTPTSELNMFKCANCEFETKVKRNIRLHMRKHINSAPETVKCEKCNLTLKNKGTLARHLRDMHPDLSEVRSFECYTCGFVSSFKGNIKAHIISKHLPVR